MQETSGPPKAQIPRQPPAVVIGDPMEVGQGGIGKLETDSVSAIPVSLAPTVSVQGARSLASTVPLASLPENVPTDADHEGLNDLDGELRKMSLVGTAKLGDPARTSLFPAGKLSSSLDPESIPKEMFVAMVNQPMLPPSDGTSMPSTSAGDLPSPWLPEDATRMPLAAGVVGGKDPETKASQMRSEARAKEFSGTLGRRRAVSKGRLKLAGHPVQAVPNVPVAEPEEVGSVSSQENKSKKLLATARRKDRERTAATVEEHRREVAEVGDAASRARRFNCIMLAGGIGSVIFCFGVRVSEFRLADYTNERPS